MSAELEVLQTVIRAGAWIAIALIFAPVVKYVVRRFLEVRELEIRSDANTETKKRPEEDQPKQSTPTPIGGVFQRSGELDEHDRAENELSLREGYRLLSAYRDRNDIKFWIITEADRSATTVLLPEDY